MEGHNSGQWPPVYAGGFSFFTANDITADNFGGNT